MPHALIIFAERFIRATATERFLALSEGLVKIRCLEVALSLGWTVQEGAGTSPLGKVADFVSERGQTPFWVRKERTIAPNQGSCDLTIVDPFLLLLEIKTRPDYGTKSQAQFQEMDADVARVAASPQNAFLFVFDPRMYCAFSGQKTETRGRPALAAQWFTQAFPPANSIPDGRPLLRVVKRDGTDLNLGFWRLPHHSGQPGVLAIGCRSDAQFFCSGE